MGFCPKCGKELADGEVCSCQAKKSSAINSAAVDNEVSGMVATAKELVLNPAQGVKNFVKNAGWLQVGVLAAIETILVIVFRMISMVRTNIRHYHDVKKWADQADSGQVLTSIHTALAIFLNRHLFHFLPQLQFLL